MRILAPAFRRPAVTSALLLTSALSGCAGWHSVAVTPEALLTDPAPRLVRFTFTDRPTYTLRNPTLTGDSVTGELAGSPVATPQQQALPLNTISAMAVRRTNVGRTVLLVVGGVVVLGLVQCAATQCLDLGAPY